MKKVLVGMSGGVDSSVCALILREKGYDVTGVTLKLFSDEDINQLEKAPVKCGSLTDAADAKSVADKLGFEHITLNFRDNFRKYVMTDFVNSYFAGATPANDYTPNQPFTLTIKAGPYADANPGYKKLHIHSGGADNDREIILRQKGDGTWLLWDQFLLVSIRTPKSADPWA